MREKTVNEPPHDWTEAALGSCDNFSLLLSLHVKDKHK